MHKYNKIGIIADINSQISLKTYRNLMKKYTFYDAVDSNLSDFDLIIVLGGDGMMLKAMHKYIEYNIPFYGINRGSVGFLMNDYDKNDLLKKLNEAIVTKLHPLKMTVKTIDGADHTALAINEVSLLRQTNQAAKIKISINNEVRLDQLVADGILVATPAGSSAYNFAANGPIIPLDANILALTPICPFRPRRWRGALLSYNSKVRFDILESSKRPVSAVADSDEVRDVERVEIDVCTKRVINVLFDQHIFEERVIKEQFMA